jgi:hypothetical protein
MFQPSMKDYPVGRLEADFFDAVLARRDRGELRRIRVPWPKQKTLLDRFEHQVTTKGEERDGAGDDGN